MEFTDFDTYLGTIDNVVESSVSEFRDYYEECINRLAEIRVEAEKRTAKSCFLLPKTPAAKRRKRRAVLEIVLEDDESESGSNASMVSPRRTRSTRTRNASNRKLNLENIAPETYGLRNSSRRTASKNACQKMNAEINETQNRKLHRQSKVVHVEESVKTSDQKIQEGQPPLKSRRIEECTEFKTMVPLVERLNFSVTNKSIHQTFKTSVEESGEVKLTPLFRLNTTVTMDKGSHTLLTSLDVSAKKSMVPLFEKLNKSVARENASQTLVSSSINVENQKQNDNQLLKHIDNISTSTVTSTNCNSTVPKVSLSESKSDRESAKRSTRLSQNRNSFENDENLENSLTCSLRDFTESGNAAGDHLFKKERKTFSVCENSEMNLSLKDVKNAANNSITAESKNKANITFNVIADENSPVPIETDPIQASAAKVISEPHKSNSRNSDVLKDLPGEEPCGEIQSPILSKTRKVSRFGHHATPDEKSIKPMAKKPTEVFSPYANEPVRERVAAFERLQTDSDVPMQPPASPEKPPVRITRTKTRAMAKAEAAAAAKPENGNASKKEVNDNSVKNFYSQYVWKTARKSIAKAKKRSIKNQNQEKAINEAEMSKENSILMSTSKYNTGTPLGGMNRNTPLSSSNISNTNSTHRIVGFGSSTGRFLATKPVGNIVIGVESFITKQVGKPTLEDIREMKEDEIRRRREKEEEARRKREEALKEKIEERKRKREEKMEKVLKQREALERQKLDLELRQQKEKEEKLKLTMQEREDRLKEQMMHKKQHAQQKAAENEERRRLEEIARVAKLKEQEEEQRRLQATKKKEQEELAKRLAEEKEAAALREQQAAKIYQMQMKLLKEKEEMKLKVPHQSGLMDKTFEITENSGKHKGHNYDNYGIDSSDCSDDECVPTRPIPVWAKKETRLQVLMANRHKSKKYQRFFVCDEKTPDLKLMFSQFKIKQRLRTSSAIWKTPPLYNALPKF